MRPSKYSATPFDGARAKEEQPMAIPAVVRRRATIVPLRDRAVEATGFGPISEYWQCYLPIVGPASWLLYRHLAPLIGSSDRAVVDLIEVAREVGLRPSVARNSPLVQSLTRLETYGLASWRCAGEYAVRRAVPVLSARSAQRLPPQARGLHHRIVAARGWS